MKFKIGDIVKFLNEKGRGKVSKIINKTTVGITIEDGFELPFLISELIMESSETEVIKKVVHDQIPILSVLNEVYSVKINKSSIDNTQAIYLAFSPESIDNIIHSDINVWLINNTTYNLLITYSILNNNKFTTLETANINSLSSELIETIDKAELNNHTHLKVDVLFFNDKEHLHHPPISEIVKLKPIKLYKQNAFEANKFINQKSLLLPVFELSEMEQQNKMNTSAIDFSKILSQKLNFNDSPKKSKPHANNNPANEMEIDLHIEELLENYSGMNNAEIVQVQLKEFQNALDTAINNHCRRLIVIHGVGNGRLKQEVRNILLANKSLKFYDASYARYGFGATEIAIG
ncbi:MAG: DUF2027 domain-containing protein [Bacteroidia bacterium]